MHERLIALMAWGPGDFADDYRLAEPIPGVPTRGRGVAKIRRPQRVGPEETALGPARANSLRRSVQNVKGRAEG